MSAISRTSPGFGRKGSPPTAGCGSSATTTANSPSTFGPDYCAGAVRTGWQREIRAALLAAVADHRRQYRQLRIQLEAILIELGTGERLPRTDLMVHAWRSAPRIIRNRADLVHSAANTYGELRAELDNELKNLKLYWEGTACQAFSHYADRAVAYLTQLETQTRWLAEEGKKAASMLEGLRNAYADLGYQQIGTLIEALTNYLDAVRSLFSSCSDPEKALLDVVHAFVGYLVDAQRRYVEAMSGLIRIDEQERKERPDLGTRGHDTTPFPQPEVGTDAWVDRGNWRPRADRPAA
ncbi:hypothetical protein [Micromonospora sp. HM5-17]|uniref:hypothetical protein n=1 Tax=Micromonospora sp. HM5-17 TaxID=2487710 RepID=UPI000F4860A7|nr:hypothetical protein [Micromonospora sp. HM5-17]ROT31115.1 hypothetical protein EF879_15880 [Micromonospora sp. HM5-17]